MVLGSGSVFRRMQLEHLGIAFQTASPDFDETPSADEGVRETVLCLAEDRARPLAGRFPAALVVGADQVAWCGDGQLGKSINVVATQQMLATLSDKAVEFYSAVVLLNTAVGRMQHHMDRAVVAMRKLGKRGIRRYLERELDTVYCAGAVKNKGLDAALLVRIDSTDPNALTGLPSFRLINFLYNEGVEILRGRLNDMAGLLSDDL